MVKGIVMLLVMSLLASIVPTSYASEQEEYLLHITWDTYSDIGLWVEAIDESGAKVESSLSVLKYDAIGNNAVYENSTNISDGGTWLSIDNTSGIKSYELYSENKSDIAVGIVVSLISKQRGIVAKNYISTEYGGLGGVVRVGSDWFYRYDKKVYNHNNAPILKITGDTTGMSLIAYYNDGYIDTLENIGTEYRGVRNSDMYVKIYKDGENITSTEVLSGVISYIDVSEPYKANEPEDLDIAEFSLFSLEDDKGISIGNINVSSTIEDDNITIELQEVAGLYGINPKFRVNGNEVTATSNGSSYILTISKETVLMDSIDTSKITSSRSSSGIRYIVVTYNDDIKSIPITVEILDGSDKVLYRDNSASYTSNDMSISLKAYHKDESKGAVANCVYDGDKSIKLPFAQTVYGDYVSIERKIGSRSVSAVYSIPLKMYNNSKFKEGIIKGNYVEGNNITINISDIVNKDNWVANTFSLSDIELISKSTTGTSWINISTADGKSDIVSNISIGDTTVKMQLEDNICKGSIIYLKFQADTGFKDSALNTFNKRTGAFKIEVKPKAHNPEARYVYVTDGFVGVNKQSLADAELNREVYPISCNAASDVIDIPYSIIMDSYIEYDTEGNEIVPKDGVGSLSIAQFRTKSGSPILYDTYYNMVYKAFEYKGKRSYYTIGYNITFENLESGAGYIRINKPTTVKRMNSVTLADENVTDEIEKHIVIDSLFKEDIELQYVIRSTCIGDKSKYEDALGGIKIAIASADSSPLVLDKDTDTMTNEEIEKSIELKNIAYTGDDKLSLSVIQSKYITATGKEIEITDESRGLKIGSMYKAVSGSDKEKPYIMLTKMSDYITGTTLWEPNDRIEIDYKVYNTLGSSAKGHLTVKIVPENNSSSNEMYLYVHRKPIASFYITCKKDASSERVSSIEKVGCNSYDIDHTVTGGVETESLSEPSLLGTNGIRAYEWTVYVPDANYKETKTFDADDTSCGTSVKARDNGVSWVKNKLTSYITPDKDREMIVTLRVRDVDGDNYLGVWSDPCTKTIGSGDNAPEAMFKLDKSDYIIDSANKLNIVFTDESIDPDGDPLEKWYLVVTSPDGTKKNLTYSSLDNNTISTDISSEIANMFVAMENSLSETKTKIDGNNFKIELTVESKGLKSRAYSRTCNVYREYDELKLGEPDSGNMYTYYIEDKAEDGVKGDTLGTAGNYGDLTHLFKKKAGTIYENKLFPVSCGSTIDIDVEYEFNGQTVSERSLYSAEGDNDFYRIYKDLKAYNIPFTRTFTNEGFVPGVYKINMQAYTKIPDTGVYNCGGDTIAVSGETYASKQPYHLYLVPSLYMLPYAEFNGYTYKRDKKIYKDGTVINKSDIPDEAVPEVGDKVTIYCETNVYVDELTCYSYGTSTKMEKTDEKNGDKLIWSCSITVGEVNESDSEYDDFGTLSFAVIGKTYWGSPVNPADSNDKSDIPSRVKVVNGLSAYGGKPPASIIPTIYPIGSPTPSPSGNPGGGGGSSTPSPSPSDNPDEDGPVVPVASIKLMNFRVTSVSDNSIKSLIEDKIDALKTSGNKLGGTGLPVDGIPVSELAIDKATVGSNLYMAKGYSFYFALDSKGLNSDDDTIEIVPYFYKAITDSDGNVTSIGDRVYEYLPNSSGEYINTTYNSASTSYPLYYEGGKIHSLGNHAKITIGSSLRSTSADGKYQTWKGRYGIPLDAKFGTGGNTLSTEYIGKVVIAFKIEAKRGTASKFDYIRKDQWSKERTGSSRTVYVNKENTTAWKETNGIGSVLVFDDSLDLRDKYTVRPVWND